MGTWSPGVDVPPNVVLLTDGADRSGEVRAVGGRQRRVDDCRGAGAHSDRKSAGTDRLGGMSPLTVPNQGPGRWGDARRPQGCTL